MSSSQQPDLPVRCRGVRGAVTAAANTPDAILSATHTLLTALIDTNQIDPDDVASLFITTSADLNAEYPAIAARRLGWVDVAILCGHEMNVPHGLKQCIRVMIHWNTTRTAQEIQHLYLGDAQALRPDRAVKVSPCDHRSG